MSSSKTLLITGATGKQGGGVIRALLKSPESEFNIIALSRRAKSRGAQSLATHPRVTIVEGDLDNAAAIFDKIGPVWGVYSVQIASPGTDTEEKQGKALVDAAIINGVSHFVYSSSDRGGPIKSPNNPTDVGNFLAKYNIEKYLEAKVTSSKSQMTYTILRPVTFFENLTTDRHGLGFARMWEQIGDKKLQLVSTNDIGWFAAQAFLHPDRYRNVAQSIAGDELTQPEAAVIFKQVVGKDMALAPCLIGSALKYVIKELGPMFEWFEKVGYGADVEECRRLNPEMQDLRKWLSESSDFVKRG